MAAPIFGLKATSRAYQCAYCQHVHAVVTNHTEVCFGHCPGCYWRGGTAPDGTVFKPERWSGLGRPHIYVGEPPKPEEYNPHAKGTT